MHGWEVYCVMISLSRRRVVPLGGLVAASHLALMVAMIIAPSCGPGDAHPPGEGGGGNHGNGCLDDTTMTSCPGRAVTVIAGSPVSVDGDLPCDPGKLIPYCSSDPGGAVLYDVTPAATGTLHAKLSDASGTLFAYGAAQCGVASKIVGCAKSDSSAELYFRVQEGLHYFVAVEGTGWKYGPDYELTLELNVAPDCGNGVLEDGEQCDLGKSDKEEDGCEDCKILPPPATDSSDGCPGNPVVIKPNNPAHIESYTTGFLDDVRSCGAPAGGPDRIFRITPTVAGTMNCKVSSDFDAVLAVYQRCPPSGVLDGLVRCSDKTTLSGSESVSIKVEAQADYYVVIDGYGPASFGAFTMDVTLE
ncbi:hypothetical protein BE21_52735 [Sorangium cellulosum]|uniref:Peptidase C-terminal archaeal/bacterial domain-containing protein n=1 Tax=Sorangium cellulosum TaxID=56 RepID=A0A150TEU9_SORCE|nr:hypothetical protein BE21_52735 [Sorangium cellulosum]